MEDLGHHSGMAACAKGGESTWIQETPFEGDVGTRRDCGPDGQLEETHGEMPETCPEVYTKAGHQQGDRAACCGHPMLPHMLLSSFVI